MALLARMYSACLRQGLLDSDRESAYQTSNDSALGNPRGSRKFRGPEDKQIKTSLTMGALYEGAVTLQPIED